MSNEPHKEDNHIQQQILKELIRIRNNMLFWFWLFWIVIAIQAIMISLGMIELNLNRI